MSANLELSRRRFLKAAAGGAAALAFIPFPGERGRVTAQEATPQQTPETAIVIPKSETPEDYIEEFTALVTKNMNPQALEHLGLAPLLTQEELGKQYELGTFRTYKGNPFEKDPNVTLLEYGLMLPDTANYFEAFYTYDDQRRDALSETIRFVGGADRKLRQKGDTTLIPYDKLQSDAYFFFNLLPGAPPDGIDWKDWSEISPDQENGHAICGVWEKDTPLVEDIMLHLHKAGDVELTHFKAEPQPTQERQNTKQKTIRGLEMALRGRDMVLERISTRFNINPGRFNTPQV